MWSIQSLVFLVRFCCYSFTFIVPSYFTMFCTEMQSDLASLLSNKRKVCAGRIRKKYITIFVLTGLVKAAENGHEHFRLTAFWGGFISISIFTAPMKWTHLFNGSAWMTQTADRWYKCSIDGDDDKKKNNNNTTTTTEWVSFRTLTSRDPAWTKGSVNTTSLTAQLTCKWAAGRWWPPQERSYDGNMLSVLAGRVKH